MNKIQSPMMRTQLEMSPEKIAELEELMRATDLNTKKDLFNYALTFFKWAVRERQQGRIIASIDQEAGKVKEIDMPPLLAAARTAGKREG